MTDQQVDRIVQSIENVVDAVKTWGASIWAALLIIMVVLMARR